MARGVGSYSRIVSWLKLLLPLGALALLSTIFLFARSSDPVENLPVATREGLAGRASEMVTSPSYSGTTDDGAMLTIRAESARPDPDTEGRIRAQALDAAMSFEDGSRIDLSAPEATIDDESDAARLTGGVTIRSSQGYRLTTDALDAALTRVEVESDGPVEGQGPSGTLSAGKMRVEAETGEGADTGAVRLLFTGGVDMIYQP